MINIMERHRFPYNVDLHVTQKLNTWQAVRELHPVACRRVPTHVTDIGNHILFLVDAIVHCVTVWESTDGSPMKTSRPDVMRVIFGLSEKTQAEVLDGCGILFNMSNANPFQVILLKVQKMCMKLTENIIKPGLPDLIAILPPAGPSMKRSRLWFAPGDKWSVP